MTAARTGRRLLTLPLGLAWHALVLATLPLTLAIASVVAVPCRSSRPVRTVLLLAAHSLIDVAAVARICRGRGDADVEDTLRWVLDRGYRAVCRILDVRVVIEQGSATAAQVHAADGVVVLARHCGPGDSLLIAWLLARHYGMSLSVVLKGVLRIDPAIDLAGDRLPFYFVGLRHRRAREGVEHLAAGLGPGRALLLFPEGANFSRRRWARAVRRLSSAGEFVRARWARRNRHTLPPRLGGALTAVRAAPTASVLLLAHSGLGEDGRDRPWWRLPVGQDLLVRTLLVPPEEVTRDEDGAADWLDAAWDRIDTWVDSHATLSALTEAEGRRR